jgi:hypothetical protein
MVRKNITGITYGSVYINPNYQQPISQTYAIITNLEAHTIQINLKLQNAATVSTHYVIPRNLSLSSYDSLEFPDERVLMANDKYVLTPTGSVDYNFNFVGDNP